MKFSIITPTHRPTYIQELYESIKAQTYTDWEWIIHLNGGITIKDLPAEISADLKVKIYEDTPCDLSPNVGYQKNKAFHLGTGDILVEVDHDDILIEMEDGSMSKAIQFKHTLNLGVNFSLF